MKNRSRYVPVAVEDLTRCGVSKATALQIGEVGITFFQKNNPKAIRKPVEFSDQKRSILLVSSIKGGIEECSNGAKVDSSLFLRSSDRKEWLV